MSAFGGKADIGQTVAHRPRFMSTRPSPVFPPDAIEREALSTEYANCGIAQKRIRASESI
jgi:hypothetical protein